MKWHVLKSSYLFQNKWLTIRKDHVRLPSGYEMNDFYIIEQPSFVNIIAVDRHGNFILEKQYRHGLQQINYELPAGKIDKEETPLQAAKRELLEETGYSSDNWAEYYISVPNASSMTNHCFTFIAIDVEQNSDRYLEESEEIEICIVTKEELIKLLSQKQIIEGVHQAPLWKYLFEQTIKP